ncbi:MAG: bifunctional 4-hydroxy-3-methylbut-2-enyl diphosphate reductase/30S ribosomal protein S1 [Bacillota bacterium]|nr:bifunctional 4-hydroxy-3-methylbut-2-enyl diphosphate reductase/30S ribosomal protein S1 [Bacillota bacterium]
MNMLLADKAGFCFGVKRAVDEALKTQEKYNKKVYTLGPLIHNDDVVEFLKKKEIYPIELKNIDLLNQDDVIIIRSHGISPDILNVLLEKKLIIIDATCPFVSNIQQKAKKYYELGYCIVIVGDKNHPEVVGINGWCNNTAVISKDGTEINLENAPQKICVLSQTTEKQENFQKVLNTLIKKVKELAAFNTICSATEERQKSAEQLSKEVDLMVVLGGYNSSNTTKLYEICSENCLTIHVENSGEIPDKILKSNKIKKIGITAGASTPDWIIKEAIYKMSNFENEGINEQLEFMEKEKTSIAVGEIIKGEVISISPNEKGVFVNIGYKLDGVLPKNEIASNDDAKLSDIFKAGDEIVVKVISRKNEDGNVVLSQIEIEREKAFKDLKSAFENKETVTVVVKEAVKGGLVANSNGVRIFIPASHIELYHIDDLSEYIGKSLTVNIVEFNQDKKYTKIVGSRREILKQEQSKKEEGTWNSLQVGDIIESEVKRLTDFGAFVDVNGVDGLLHVSEISWGRVNKASDVLKVGDKIKVYVLDLDKEKRKLSLSLKKLIDDPWINVDEKYPVDNVVLGKVVRFANFGAFVELEPGVDALVHISQISHKRINKPSDALEIGQQIKAKIIEVNKENKKITLSIKEVAEI